MAGAQAAAPHTHVRLILSAETARPGEQVLAGVHLTMDPGWHTFWKNGGDIATPTTLELQLPSEISAGAIQWSIPEKEVDRDPTSNSSLASYIYEREAFLLIPLTVSTNAKPGKAKLGAKLSWQECEKVCVPPRDVSLEATLEIGSESSASSDAVLLTTWQGRMPKRDTNMIFRAVWEKPNAGGDTRAAVIEWNSSAPDAPADFFPEANKDFDIAGDTRKLASVSGKSRLRIEVKKSANGWPAAISGLLVQGQGSGQVGYEAAIPINEPPPSRAGTGGAVRFDNAKISWAQMLLSAFLGGLILNIMPCVLPVIALKILGFVQDAHHEPRHVRKLGIVYTLGVLASFVGLAVITLALKAAGQGAGWGFQFGNPYFILAMVTLVTVISLNLFGVFEITLSSRALTAANELAAKQGVTGAFFNGFLATVLATSCSAPLLGPALGFAASLKSPALLLLFWLTVGLGMAAPYLILSFQPGWLRFLPKPGPWMTRFKVAMGFPMLGAVVWLCSLAAVHYGERVWGLAAFLVFVAVAAWVYGEFVQRGSKYRGVAMLLALLLLGSGYFVGLERQLEWRKPITASAADPVAGERRARGVHPRGLKWEPWSPEAVAAARASSRVVVVDFTANWCATCNLLVKPALEDSQVQKKLSELNAVLLVADYTLTPNPAIQKELENWKRDAVPLVLVYPRNPDAQTMLFDLPTASVLVKALEQAAKP